MTAIGYPELAAPDWAAYEDLAVTLATQPERLRELHQGLSVARATAPLFDTRGWVALPPPSYAPPASETPPPPHRRAQLRSALTALVAPDLPHTDGWRAGSA